MSGDPARAKDRAEDQEIGARLRQVTAGHSVTGVAGIARTSPNNWRRWLAGEGSADAKALARIADAFDVSLRWLLTGQGARDRAGADIQAEPDTIEVPMVAATASAGPGSFAVSETKVGDWPFPRAWFLARFGGPRESLKLIRVRGDSMLPELRDGDWVMVDTKMTARRSGLAVVLAGDELLVKRLRFEPGRVWIISANQAYEPVLLEGEDMNQLKIIGRVEWTSSLQPS